LSRDCNNPALAKKTVQQEIDKTGARHIRIHQTEQDGPIPTLVFEHGSKSDKVAPLSTSESSSEPIIAKSDTPEISTPHTAPATPNPKPTANQEQHHSFFSGLQDVLGDEADDSDLETE
jgi:hypothetical protein